MAWEYRIVTTSGADEDDEAALNELGAEGWELVTVLASEVYVGEENEDEEEEEEFEETETVLTYYLKRQS